jgi:DNA-binding CsgD family transcriptional regulator
VSNSSRKRSTSVLIRTLSHPPHTVWAALTGPQQMEHWATFVSDANLAILGATLSMADGSSTTTFSSEVTWAVSLTLLEYTWGEALLVWELSPTTTGARLTLRHTVEGIDLLFKPAVGWHVRQVVEEHVMNGMSVAATSADGCGSGNRTLRPALSERQATVLQALLEGKSNKEIARKLDIAGGTVRNHLWSIYQALGVNSRLKAVARAYELGLIDRKGPGTTVNSKSSR